jgi:hypothetical protein
MKRKSLNSTLVAVALTIASYSQVVISGPIYMATSTIDAVEELDYTYGADGWEFSVLNANLFNASNDFIFLNGNSEALNFLTDNKNDIESWVVNGGHLLFNTWGVGSGALYEGDMLFDSSYTSEKYNWRAKVLEPELLIGLVDDEVDGVWINHGSVSGDSSYTSLIKGVQHDNDLLIGKNVGSGYYAAGSLTFELFSDWNHISNDRDLDMLPLAANILNYTADRNIVDVPEPSTLIMFILGVMSLTSCRLKKILNQ